jgi:hypothetical protein
MKKIPLDAIVRVHRSNLTDEERKHRMKAINEAAVRLITATARSRKEHT